METLDEQLDSAQARLTEQTALIATLESQNEVLSSANAELKENLLHAQKQHADAQEEKRSCLQELEELKAQAKTAEEKAAEFYGVSSKPQDVTPQGDEQSQSVHERFKAIKDATAQTSFIRSLTPNQRTELFSKL